MEQLMAISYLLGFFTAIIFIDYIGDGLFKLGYSCGKNIATLISFIKNLTIMIRTGKIGQKK